MTQSGAVPGMVKRRGKGEVVNIIIRREEEVVEAHHGGAWKVAYADFVTAMMAFFLLMWLLNATTEQQRRGIAAYFSPLANVENGFSGAGLVPGGISPLDKGTSLVARGTGAPPADAPPQTVSIQTAPGQVATDGDGIPATPDSDDDAPPSGLGRTAAVAGQGSTVALAVEPDDGGGPSSLTHHAEAAAEDASLKDAAARMRSLVGADPALAEFAGQMAIDVTPDGLCIQIMDREGLPMFDRGATTLNARASALLRKVAPFLETLPEPVSIGGYTDAAPWPSGGISNWTLSSGRADAARDLLVRSGLSDRRISEVTAFADRHLLLPADPLASANRRIVLTLRRQHAGGS
ncbi:OmpA family protein [Lichenicola cladoniae]|uniref:OmpA family protein n=1 Tax=Lichenicola cladoniae TaxID=1484109 RepID=A0A6M8HUC4_9PROT|nr:flagellar motor protein MotB [Lichenicola cladoniae]NPD67549.1 OmpA family protein [Acetobacteraceae bacterium]QKE91801.1 OmpA family protein [Lichenicola cladoniae]